MILILATTVFGRGSATLYGSHLEIFFNSFFTKETVELHSLPVRQLSPSTFTCRNESPCETPRDCAIA